MALHVCSTILFCVSQLLFPKLKEGSLHVMLSLALFVLLLLTCTMFMMYGLALPCFHAYDTQLMSVVRGKFGTAVYQHMKRA